MSFQHFCIICRDIIVYTLFSFFLIVISWPWFFFSTLFLCELSFPLTFRGWRGSHSCSNFTELHFLSFSGSVQKHGGWLSGTSGLLLLGLSRSWVPLISVLIRFVFISWNFTSVWGLSWKEALSGWFLDHWGLDCSGPSDLFIWGPYSPLLLERAKLLPVSTAGLILASCA